MRRPAPITTLFVDVGGVLLTNGIIMPADVRQRISI